MLGPELTIRSERRRPFSGRHDGFAACVAVDRESRRDERTELPIQPDIVGKQVKVDSGERVDVLVEELDGRDEVHIVRPGSSA